MKNIDALLRDERLSRIAPSLERLALPSIRLKRVATKEDNLPLGASKLGGSPDFPPELTWPTWKEMPLVFVAQINLDEIQAFDLTEELPPSGILYFFYDADHVPTGYDPALRGGWSVLYHNGALASLQRLPVPSPLREKEPTWVPEGQHYNACAVTFSREITLPPIESTYIEALSLSQGEEDSYRNLLETIQGRNTAPIHRLLGYPNTLQGDMQLESQLVSHGIYLGEGLPKDMTQVQRLRGGVQDWQLLLQLDTDPEAEMLWGIEGRIYYWIQTQALRKHQFENTWLIMQWT